jgi:hypothetical protein
MARRGWAWLGTAGEAGQVTARRGGARRGEAVEARRGAAGQGGARLGSRGEAGQSRRGEAGLGWAWRGSRGTARQGSARPGRAVEARQGVAWMYPKGETAKAARRKRVLARQRRDRQESDKVRIRSKGWCEWVGCSHRATEVHHELFGIGVRGRGDSALADNKRHYCQRHHQCAHDLHRED